MVKDIFDYDNAKSDWYFSGARKDWVSKLPVNPNARILELGCAYGGTGALALAEKKCGTYIGIEIAPEAARHAKEKLTDVIVGNIETMELDLEPNSFDYLMMSEVLEHLVDPWRVVSRLVTYLKPGGGIFASSPNVSHRDIVVAVLKGRWDLADSGAMDRTHLRWFTPTTYRQMFEDVGVETVSLGHVGELWNKYDRWISKLSRGRLDYLVTFQIDYQGRKPPV